MHFSAASVLNKFYWSRSEYYEEPNDTPDSCLYICVENYFGKRFVAPKEFLHELKSFAFINIFYSGISGEWGDKSCTESGTTKYLCEKK